MNRVVQTKTVHRRPGPLICLGDCLDGGTSNDGWQLFPLLGEKSNSLGPIQIEVPYPKATTTLCPWCVTNSDALHRPRRPIPITNYILIFRRVQASMLFEVGPFVYNTQQLLNRHMQMIENTGCQRLDQKTRDYFPDVAISIVWNKVSRDPSFTEALAWF
jgi:hypothetical protein